MGEGLKPGCEGRQPGRPRCEETCGAIREAALKVLEERGFMGLTIEEVAARAGAGKATVYRWWSGKGELIVDAFFAKVAPQLGFKDTGSLRGDFTQQMRLLVNQMRGPNGKVLAALIAGAQMDEALADAVRTRWITLRRAEGRKAVDRAVSRGELPKDVDVHFLFDLLYSPLYFRLLVRHQPLTEELADRIVDAVLDGALGGVSGGATKKAGKKSGKRAKRVGGKAE